MSPAPRSRILVAIALCTLLGSPAAARTISAGDQRVSGDPAAAALRFVRANAQRFGSAESATLYVARQTRLPDGVALRIGQRLDGLRAIDAGVDVLVLRGRLVTASGELARLEPARRAPAIGPRQAAAALTAKLPGAQVRRSELAWLRRPGAAARRVWALDVRTVRPFGLLEVWVDADSGQLLGRRPTLRRVQGKAYPSSPSRSQVELVELLGLQGDGKQLVGEHADVSSCKVTWSAGGSSECVRHAAPDTDGDFLADPVEPSLEDAFAEVHTYYHVDRVHRWFKEQLGFSRAGPTQQIKVMVNTSFEGRDGNTRGLYNAMFADMDGDGRGELVFGQGDRDFAYDADVIYHEFSHSVIDALAKLDPGFDALGLNLEPLAINEGSADFFAAVVSGDPAIGEYAGGSSAIRSLAGGGARCPDSLIGESHNDGLLWGETAWAIRSKLAAAEQASFDSVLYQTLAGLGAAPAFADVAAVLLKVAQSVAPALAPAVQAELTARNLTGCTRIIPLAPAAPREVYLLGSWSLGAAFAPAAYQYSVEVPANALKVELAVSYDYELRGESGVGLFIRKGQPVGFDVQVAHDLALPNPELKFAMAVGDAQRPLQPGATYYVLPVNVAHWGAEIKLSVAITEAPPPPLPDAGVDAAAPDAGIDATPADDASVDAGAAQSQQEGGCSCELGARAGAAGARSLPPLALLLALLALLHRRARWRAARRRCRARCYFFENETPEQR